MILKTETAKNLLKTISLSIEGEIHLNIYELNTGIPIQGAHLNYILESLQSQSLLLNMDQKTIDSRDCFPVYRVEAKVPLATEYKYGIGI